MTGPTPIRSAAPRLPDMPEHLRGVLFAYDEAASALVCIEARVAITLPWLVRAGWRGVSHEGLLASLPPVFPRVAARRDHGLVDASGVRMERR
jgi:hypothetical protein